MEDNGDMSASLTVQILDQHFYRRSPSPAICDQLNELYSKYGSRRQFVHAWAPRDHTSWGTDPKAMPEEHLYLQAEPSTALSCDSPNATFHPGRRTAPGA